MSHAPLLVLGWGMTTAVGLTAAASCAALRARLDGLRETRFVLSGGRPLVGAEVPLDPPLRGLQRLAYLVAGPICECLDQEPGLRPENVPLLLGVAEVDRPGRLGGMDEALLPAVEEMTGCRFHPASRLLPMGRVAGAFGIREAARLLGSYRIPRVIVAGVDSYLLSATINAFLVRNRLLTAQNSNGFIPGEAASAVLVGRRGTGAALRILSLGTAAERATIEGEEPLRGEGLATAFSQALRAAGLQLGQIGCRLSTLSGEQYFFKELDLATVRLLRGKHDEIELWHPAASVGETGAAACTNSIVLAAGATRGGWAPRGGRFLIAAANDDEHRAALVADGLVA